MDARPLTIQILKSKLKPSTKYRIIHTKKYKTLVLFPETTDTLLLDDRPYQTIIYQNYIYVDQEPIYLVTKKAIDTKTCQGIVKINNYNSPYNISYLVCGQLRYNNLADIFAKKPCSTYGGKISSSLVRIAATRIFSNPYQSILEIPVNSLDAYTQGRTVGKFGMGFFSFLYWLIGHPKRYVEILSTFRQPNDQLCSWLLHIQERDGNLQFYITIRDKPEEHTGTTVQLIYRDDIIYWPEILLFKRQLMKLRYTDIAQIFVTTPDFPYQLINPDQKYKTSGEVLIDLGHNSLFIKDKAKGISLETCFKSLLIPSVSTKTIALSEEGQQDMHVGQLTNIKPATTNIFRILVGRIAVIVLDFTYPGEPYEVIIDLPINTRLPVSRDDILLTSEASRKNFSKNLMQLQKMAFVNRNFAALSFALKTYITYTQQRVTKTIIGNLLEMSESHANKQGLTFVPYKYADIYTALGRHFVAAETFDIPYLEKDLLKRYKWNNDIYFGKNVTLLDSKEIISNGGTSQFLFIQRSYTENNRNWQTDIPLFYYNDKLYPTGLLVSNGANTQIVAKIADISTGINLTKKVEKYLYNLLLKLQSMDTYFKVSFGFGTLIKFVYQYFDEATTIDIILRLFNMMNNIIPTHFTYGDSSPWFNDVGLYETDIGTDAWSFERSGSRLLCDPPETKTDKYGMSILSIFSSGMKKAVIKPVYKNKKMLDLTLDYYKLIFEEQKNWQKYSKYCTVPAFLRICDGILDCAISVPYAVINNLASYDVKPLSFVSLLLKIYNMLIEKSKNIVEYFILHWTFVHYLSWNGYEQRLEDKDLLAECMDYIFNVMHRQYTYDILKSLMIDFLLTRKYDNIRNVVIQYLVDNIRIFLDQTRLIQNLEELAIPNPPNQYNFRASTMIDYVFHHDTVEWGQVEKWRPKGGLSLQAMEIAINEGTNKPFITAVLTETIQNSIDAVRIKNPSNKNIGIEISTIDGGIAMSIIDYVGIPHDGLVAIMLPFLSTKTPSEIVTGEMGSGFFNIYRESSMVIIETLLDNHYTKITDIPLMDDHGRIVDLDKYIYSAPERADNFTRITSIMMIQDKQVLLETISEIVNFAQTVLSLIHVPGIDIYIFGNIIRSPTQEVFSAADFDMRMAVKDVEYQEGIQQVNQFKSYIMTKGIPFLEFYDYFVDKQELPEFLLVEMRSNILLNIKHGAYTPVQSRTSLNISHEAREKLFKFIYNGMYIAIMTRIDEQYHGWNNYIPNHQSQADASQVSFIVGHIDDYTSLSDFVLYHILTDESVCLAELINIGIHALGKDRMSDFMVEPRIIRALQSKTVNQLLIRVVLSWLKEKNKNQSTNFMNNAPEKKVYTIPPILSKFTQRFVDVFWKMGLQAETTKIFQGTHFGNNPRAPLCEWQPIESNTLGYYKPADHKIVLNIAAVRVESFVDQLKNLNKNNIIALQNVPEFASIFGIRFPASTLVHELAHAWRNSGHEVVGSHDSIYLTIDGKKERMDYEAAANAVFTWMLRNNFYEQLV